MNTVMYPVDFACGLAGVSDYQIRQMEKLALITPEKIAGMKYYSFSDLLIIKLIAVLIREGIKYKKIQIALDYLKDIKPDQSLSSLNLIVQRKEIIDITDDYGIIITKYGQLINKKLVQFLSLGTEMDCFRSNIKKTLIDLKSRAHKKAQRRTLDDVGVLLYGR